MKIVVTGADSHLSLALQKTLPSQHKSIFLTRRQLNICDPKAIQQQLTALQPDIVINTAANNAIDDLESTSENEEAYAVNAIAPQYLAQTCKELNARFIHLSTAYIFDGKKNKPYKVNDEAKPLSVYGKSKWQGEKRVLDTMPENALIIRTAWNFSDFGKNFLVSILSLAKTQEVLYGINDQYSTPVSVLDVAKAIYLSIDQNLEGIHHFAGLDSVNRFTYINTILTQAKHHDLLHKLPELISVSSQEYGGAAQRPLYSALDSTCSYKQITYRPQNWELAIENFMKSISLLRAVCGEKY